MNIQGILATLGGAIGGFFLLLPFMWASQLLPKKIRDHELTPIFIGVFAGAAGMYLVVIALAGNEWEKCLPFCNK